MPGRFKLNQSGFDHVFLTIAFVVLFGVVGCFYLIYSHAAVKGSYLTGPGGKCLTNAGGKNVANNPVQLATCKNLASQKWTVDATKKQVVNSNGYCLSAASRAAGQLLSIRKCTSYPITQSTYSSSSLHLVNVASGLCVTDVNGATSENNSVNWHACGTSASQAWTYQNSTTSTPPPTGGPTSGSPYIAYPATSFFRTPLGTGWPTDSTSSTGISWHSSHEPYKYPRINGVDGNVWGMGFALGTCSDPIWKLSSSANVPASSAFLKTEGFHAPSNWTSQLADNSDAPIEVIDTCGVASRPKGFSVWAANVLYDGNSSRVLTSNPKGGTLTAGSFAHDSNGLDGRTPGHGNDNRNQTSRGNIPDSFAIRDDLLRYGMSGGNGGTLGHVLQMFSMETNSSMGFVAPMAGAENGQSGYGAEGERIALKPSWNPPTSCTGAPLVVAKTLQKYGAYLGNNAGGGSAIKAQQGSTLLHRDDLGKCFTWSDMAYVQRGYSASW